MTFAQTFAVVLFAIAALSIVAVFAAEQIKSYRAGQALALAESRARAMAAHPAGKGRI